LADRIALIDRIALTDRIALREAPMMSCRILFGQETICKVLKGDVQEK
jgi:hypothetical protein